MTGLAVRLAQDGDAPALAALHVRVWRATYADHAPQVAIDTLDETKRLPTWENAIAQQNALIATRADSIVGAACFGTSTHPAFDRRWEIKHLYVEQGHQGHGAGQRLLAAAIEKCRAKSPEARVALAVVRENAAARAFYTRQGGVEIGEFIDPGPLWRSENIVVAWDGLRPQ